MLHSSLPGTSIPPSWCRLIGIGASAGGLESLRQLLKVLPTDAGCCYVVLQHMAPSHRSMLVEILSPCCDMPVQELVDGTVPQANTVWITPPNAHALWDGQALRLSAPDAHDLIQPSIDLFLSSLASPLGARAGGVVLSGTGSDGSQGVQHILDTGGLVLVQSLSSARYTGMPEAASRVVGPEHVMELSAMGPAIAQWAQTPVIDPSPSPESELSTTLTLDQDPALLAELSELVRAHSGLNLADYKTATLARRIEKRMQHCHVANLVDYVTLLRADEQELSALMQSMLISVTSFWRNPVAFEALMEAARALLAKKPAGEPVRVWVAGCATGQEAYTIAMVWAEVLGERWHEHPLQVFATDLDQDALHIARRGLYPPQVLDDVPEPLRLRYFRPAGVGVEVVRSLRDNIVFSRHDLTRDPPFPRLDMVSCRNVLIYMTAQAQGRLLRLFHYALRTDGVLMLGQNESVLHLEHQFKSLRHEVRLYQRLPGRTPLEAPRTDAFNAASPVARSLPRGSRVNDPERDLLRQATALFVPACVLLDESWRVIQVHGDVSRFLQMRAGPQTLDVQSLSRPEIEGELRLLCAMAGDGAQDSHRVEVSLQDGRKRQRWQLSLHVFCNEQQRRLSLLSFELLPPRPRRTRMHTEVLSEAPSGFSTTEFLAAREQIKSLVEQLETVNEEMRALNEESQAAHEELQAGNEELEAANEELQATNQELATVNAELNLQSKRHQELAQELESIQNSITMPLLVIDPQCFLQRYNEAAVHLFRLNADAQGLHLSTLYRPPGIPDLVALVKEAQASASPKIVPLEPGPQGQEYVLQLSHNVVDGQRHGVVLTVLDNTALARAERQSRLTEQRLVSVLTHGKAMMAIKHISGRYEFVNEHYAAFWGVPRERWLGATDAQLLPAEVVAGLRQQDIALLRDHQLLETQEAFSLNGQTRWWWATRFGLFDDHGALEAICIQAVDLTASRQADESLRIAAKVFEVSSEGIMILDPQGNTVRVNAAFCRLTGLTPAQVLGAPPRLFDVERNGADFFATLVRKVTEQGSWQGEVWNVRDNGEMFPGWLSVSTLNDEQQRLQHIVAVLTDITALNETRENMRHLATHDPLTGLPNRNLLMDRVSHAISNARRHHSEIALCFIDLDHFKTVNDSLGHDAGDEVLRLVTRRIADNVRSSDTVARLGGDEFVLLLENTNRLETLQTVERINRALTEHVQLNGNLLSTDASIGIAFYPGDGVDGATLLRNADAAMYRAKNNGRSRYEFFSAEVGDSARNRLRIESGLRQALSQHELLLHYQPQVDACSGAVVGVEALLRWKPAHGELINPSVFLPIAEESLLIDNIGQWVLDEAFAQLAAWRSSGLTQLRLSVNVSSRQLRQRDFAERLQQLLIQHGLPGECVVLELTESALLQHDEQLNQLLRRLDQLGVQLSLDDFGTGYSSLAYLRRLPLNELKIDRSFVHGVLDRRDDREIVEAILGLGQALGLRVVAEGVETAEQWQHFRRVSSDLGIQGFHVAKPMAAQDCERWLRDAHLKMGHHEVYGHA